MGDLSLAPVVITSIMFAFVQYSETASQGRVSDKQRTLSSGGVYNSQKIGRLKTEVANELRRDYDILINKTSPRDAKKGVFRNSCGKSRSPGEGSGIEIKAAEMKVDGVAESLAVAEPAR